MGHILNGPCRTQEFGLGRLAGLFVVGVVSLLVVWCCRIPFPPSALLIE